MLQSSCFICGIGKDYFDKLPHGFEIHVKNEHNFANYMSVDRLLFSCSFYFVEFVCLYSTIYAVINCMA